MIQVGSLNQKAGPFLIGFVFSCIGLIIFLLYIANGYERAQLEFYSFYEGQKIN